MTIKSQSGQTSLIITLMLSVVISLIFLGVTRLTSSESQSNVNNEEAAQANYAAQSGINDTISAITNGMNVQPFSSQNCSTITTDLAAAGYTTSLSASPSIAYSCIYVQTQPANLQFSVSQSNSTVIAVKPSGQTRDLTISWVPSFSGPNYQLSNCTQNSLEFVPSQVWNCPYPVIRMDLYDYNPTDLTAEALAADTDMFFLFPSSSGAGTQDVSFGPNPAPPYIVPASCTTSLCQATLRFAPKFSSGYARLTGIYSGDNTVSISGDPGVNFGSTQYQIDATGIDQDVAQRLSVRVAVNSTTGTTPSTAIAGGYICKHYSLGVTGDPDYNWNNDPPLCGNALKPAIYLYPPIPELVNVKLSYPTGLEQTIPTYNQTSGWNVLAQPNGSLFNLGDDKNYPYLYWEGNLDNFDFDMNQGFVVAGSASRLFLASELPKIGLNQTETQAFIAYWAPKMVNNPYNLVHFAGSEYTDMAPLNITPKPDSVLRVFMALEPINRPVPVTPQSFQPFVRHGFTVVEWGGTVLSR